jgi:stage II sporulation protein AA (anti-sigma F factor antagonist)
VKLREETLGRTTVLVPEGDMDITALPAFEARVARLIQGGTLNLIWDLSVVSFLPSTAAGFLLQTARRIRAHGGRCVLSGGSAKVLGTLRTMGVLDLFPTYPDRQAAIADLSPG